MPSQNQRGNQRGNHKSAKRDVDTYKCMVCKDFHSLKICKRFLKMTVRMTEEAVERYRYCINCLARSHNLRACTSMNTCKICDKYHHTLLHYTSRNSNSTRGISTWQLRQKRAALKRKSVAKTSSSSKSTSSSKVSSAARLSTSDTLPATSKSSLTQHANIIVEVIKSLASVLGTTTQH